MGRLHAASDGGLVLYFSTVWRSVAWWESAPKWSTVAIATTLIVSGAMLNTLT